MSETLGTHVDLFIKRKVWRQRSHGPYYWFDRSTPGPLPLPFGTLAWIMDVELTGTGSFLLGRKKWGRPRRKERYDRWPNA